MASNLPATVTTVERFPSSVPESDIDGKATLNIKAGAITSKKSTDPKTKEWIITTVWNVIGGNDP